MPLGPGVQETINGVVYTSQQDPGGTGYSMRPDGPSQSVGGGVITRISSAGVASRHVPLTSSDEAAGAAFANALAASQNGDLIDGGGLRIDLPSGTGFSISGRSGVKLRNGKLRRRGGNSTYSRMLTLTNCIDCDVDLDFDGEAGITSPLTIVGSQLQHAVTNPNNVAGSRLLDLVSSSGTTVRGRFAQHAAQQLFNTTVTPNLPYYNGAWGVSIDSGCRDTNVLGAEFEYIGYASIRSSGINTYIGEGTVVDSGQWHGIVVHEGSCRLGLVLLKALEPSLMGFPGGLEVNGTNYSIDSIEVDGTTWVFPLNHPGTAGGGMALMKMNGVGKVSVKNSEMLHGYNRLPPENGGWNYSMRFVEGVGDVYIENFKCSGTFGHQEGDDSMFQNLNSLTMRNVSINTMQDKLGIIVTADHYDIEDSTIRYSSAGLLGRTTADRCQSLRSKNTIWQARNNENAYAVAANIIEGVTDVEFDSTNKLRNTETGNLSTDGETNNSFLNRKSHSSLARLQLSTRVDDRKKRVNSALAAGFDHGDVLEVGADPFQEITLAANSTLVKTQLPLEEGDVFQVRIKPSGFTLSVPSAWGAFDQPSVNDPFVIQATIVDDGAELIPHLLTSAASKPTPETFSLSASQASITLSAGASSAEKLQVQISGGAPLIPGDGYTYNAGTKVLTFSSEVQATIVGDETAYVRYF